MAWLEVLEFSVLGFMRTLYRGTVNAGPEACTSYISTITSCALRACVRFSPWDAHSISVERRYLPSMSHEVTR